MSCQCSDAENLTHAGTGYRRALLIVVMLNLGMGIVEMAGGLLGFSQALKADALDFLGDGLITLLGLLAISRGPRWRARAALLQGCFLAILSVAVILTAIYRVMEQKLPDVGVMTTLGIVALVVNVAAAAVLIPHRHGDASVRAVWLFSRNDALANLAVVAAAGLVFWTNTPWPDIVTALVIAGLFLSSAFEILKSSWRELHPAECCTPPATDEVRR